VKYTEVLRKGADGKWRYVVDMFSDIAPPAAAMPGKKP
jgi:ketosteroid isomerase-like protein